MPRLRSTNIAKNNWEGLAIGSALAGTGLTIGENVVGMDPESIIKNGRTLDTADLKRCVKLYQDHQRDGYGAIIVQANIEDTRLCVQEYAIEKLGVECVELKWGQGAKDIGGGTGMSPWRMMNEWGIPPVHLHSLLYQYAKRITDKGGYLPALTVAGGFAFEDQIFKGLALGAPFVKLVGMARAPIAAAMVGKTIGRTIDENQVPVYVERFGNSKDDIFVTASALRKELGSEEYEKIPTGALGLYTYYERLAQGLRQLMAGCRKFATEYIAREDIAALTHQAADISRIQYVMDVDQKEVDKILNS